MHFLPTHREIAELAEITVAKHFVGKIAELSIETQLASETSGDGIEQEWKGCFGINVFLILTDAIDTALREQIRRHE